MLLLTSTHAREDDDGPHRARTTLDGPVNPCSSTHRCCSALCPPPPWRPSTAAWRHTQMRGWGVFASAHVSLVAHERTQTGPNGGRCVCVVVDVSGAHSTAAASDCVATAPLMCQGTLRAAGAVGIDGSTFVPLTMRPPLRCG